jgi:hypothetical protein
MNWFTAKFPETVEKAVDKLIEDMSFKDKTWIANMDGKKLVQFYAGYGIFLKHELRLGGNDPLINSCKAFAGLETIDADQAAFVILREIHKRLQHSNVLKVVK